MINQFIGVLLLSRDLAHREHWKTQSYAQHVALNEFYDDILDVTDSFVEKYQGRHGIIKDVPILGEGQMGGSPVEKLKKLLKTIEDSRYDVVDKSDTALHNLIDEIVAIFLEAIYKLENLK